MDQAIADLALAYAGFLCAWRPIVSMAGERAARRYGRGFGAGVQAVMGPAVGLIFLATPIAHALVGALAAGLLDGLEPVLWAGLLILSARGLHRGAHQAIVCRYGIRTWRELRGIVSVSVPLLLALCLLIEAQLFVGLVIFAAWVALMHHRAQVARDAREEAARAQAAQTHRLRARMGEEDTPFRR